MAQMVFFNMAVKDLERSKRFFEGLGYSINPQFTDETAACVVFSDTIYAMLLTEDKLKEFTKKQPVDTATGMEDIIALSADSREAVDTLADKALALGGTEFRPPEDMGFMYGRTFEDLDGHQWEVVWMDPAQIK